MVSNISVVFNIPERNNRVLSVAVVQYGWRPPESLFSNNILNTPSSSTTNKGSRISLVGEEGKKKS